MYRSLSRIAEDVKVLLEDAGLFEEVRIAAITSYETLYKLLPDLALLPAAVICVGGGELEDGNAVRSADIGIVMIDEFRASGEDKALGIWEVLDATVNLFAPDVNRGALTINSVAYVPKVFQTLELPGDGSSFLLEIETIAPFYPNE